MVKMLNLLSVLTFIVVLCACGNGGKEHIVPLKNHHLLVFIDKSQSVNGAPEAFSYIVEGELTPVLSEMMRNKGDRLKTYLIHGATVGNQAVVDKILAITQPEGKGGPDDITDASDKYKHDLERFQKSTVKEIISYLEDKSTGDATRETDMLGTIEIISDFMANVPPQDTAMVIYMSDMVHSQKEPRDYFVQPIKDLAEAKTCAANDFTWLQSHRKFVPEKFANLKVHIIFPSGNYEQTPNDQMLYYWQEMFGKINSSVKITRN